MSITKRRLDELNTESEARGECRHGNDTYECADCEAEWDAYTHNVEPDYGGAFDGFTVYSDADPGL